jgi:hypothetical protein
VPIGSTVRLKTIEWTTKDGTVVESLIRHDFGRQRVEGDRVVVDMTGAFHCVMCRKPLTAGDLSVRTGSDRVYVTCAEHGDDNDGEEGQPHP